MPRKKGDVNKKKNPHVTIRKRPKVSLLTLSREDKVKLKGGDGDVIDLEVVKAYSKVGMYTHQIAYALGMTPNRFSALMESYPQLRQACDEGKATGDLEVLNVLYKLAVKDKYFPAIKLYVTARIGWRVNSDPLININVNSGNGDAEIKEVVDYDSAMDMYKGLIEKTS